MHITELKVGFWYFSAKYLKPLQIQSIEIVRKPEWSFQKERVWAFDEFDNPIEVNPAELIALKTLPEGKARIRHMALNEPMMIARDEVEWPECYELREVFCQKNSMAGIVYDHSFKIYSLIADGDSIFCGFGHSESEEEMGRIVDEWRKDVEEKFYQGGN